MERVHPDTRILLIGCQALLLSSVIRLMRFNASLLLALLALAVPATAAAQTATTNAPPGNSGLSQYLEVVPTASGNAPSRSGKGRTAKKTALTTGTSSAAGHVAEKRAKLAASSKDGQKLDEFAGETPQKKAAVLPKADSKSAAVASSVTGSGSSIGMGLWMPIAMAGLALIALFAGWRKRKNPDDV